MSDIQPQAGEVWQEADNVLLLCVKPGEWWRDFGGTFVPWDAPLIEHPLTRLLDAKGRLVADSRQVIEHVRDAWDQAHDEFCPRHEFCSTHARPGDRHRIYGDAQ